MTLLASSDFMPLIRLVRIYCPSIERLKILLIPMSERTYALIVPIKSHQGRVASGGLRGGAGLKRPPESTPPELVVLRLPYGLVVNVHTFCAANGFPEMSLTAVVTVTV